ncbi:MAG: DsbA family protein, partial [Alphaproteobacteria bacterium]|nr:DsbA family protein [Alphaproteobacteria bacterium]
MTRTIRFAAALIAGVLLPSFASADILSIEEAMQDRVIGNAEAPITIIEYASLTCPHCATFHAETLPQIKKEWIETGKAKLIYRDFPLDKYAASAAMIARCAPEDKYFIFLNAFYAQQKNWSRADDPVRVLTQLAGLGGMSKDDVDACLANEELQDAILQMRLDGQMEHGINSTPSFVINGKMINNLPYEDFKDILEDA